jgi:hypothetical protein
MNDLNLQVALEEISKLAAKLKVERDEARAQNAKLRDIAEWFANAWYENGSDEGWEFPVDKKARRLFKEFKQLKEAAK